MQINFPELWQMMDSHFSLGHRSFHGPQHWKRVESFGLKLCYLNGADEIVVRLFALFHDVERESEGHDPDHGRRAASLIESLHGSAFELDDQRLDLLLEACKYHNDGLTSEELTIGTCWDADRLDLPRVGIQPVPEKMSTQHGKQFAAMLPYSFTDYGDD